MRISKSLYIVFPCISNRQHRETDIVSLPTGFSPLYDYSLLARLLLPIIIIRRNVNIARTTAFPAYKSISQRAYMRIAPYIVIPIHRAAGAKYPLNLLNKRNTKNEARTRSRRNVQ